MWCPINLWKMLFSTLQTRQKEKNDLWKMLFPTLHTSQKDKKMKGSLKSYVVPN